MAYMVAPTAQLFDTWHGMKVDPIYDIRQDDSPYRTRTHAGVQNLGLDSYQQTFMIIVSLDMFGSCGWLGSRVPGQVDGLVRPIAPEWMH